MLGVTTVPTGGVRVTEIRLRKDVDAGADRVWDVMTDMDRWPEVVSGIERVERLDDGDGFGVGTRWRETRIMFRKEATEEMEVTAVDPGRSYVAEAASRGTRYRSTLTVEPVTGRSSRLTMTFDAQPRSTVSKMLGATLGKLFEGATRKALEKDLDDVAAAAERAF
jgi:carbon monoxide dehydrogenase subunit G